MGSSARPDTTLETEEVAEDGDAEGSEGEGERCLFEEGV